MDGIRPAAVGFASRIAVGPTSASAASTTLRFSDSVPTELTITVTHAAAALVPVCVFLGSLVLLDSYKLVRPRWVGYALLAGVGAALLSYLIQTQIIRSASGDFTTVSRYVAPVVEETAKAAFILVLIRIHRVGFQVDAAILGFAVGTGFALTENIYYLSNHSDMSLFTWLLRGLGTAMMHGGTTCLFAIISKTLHDRANTMSTSYVAFVPGLATAIILHSAFNHFILPPLAMTALIVGIFPVLIVAVFHQSERITRRWLGSGFDTDQEVLAALTFGDIRDDPVGRYLQDLRAHFAGEVVADMLCLIRLKAELAIKAKGILMMREAGYRAAPGAEVQAVLDEITYLTKHIGPTGMLALAPFLNDASRESWQMHLLET